MRIAVIVVAAGVAACGQSRSPTDDKYTFDLTVGEHRDRDRDHDPGRYAQQLVTPDDDPPTKTIPSTPPKSPPVVTDARCVDNLAVTDVHYKGDKVYACSDSVCATFARATGKFLETESAIAAEADDPDSSAPDATPAADPPDPDADDPRATLDTDAATVQGCPEDSACVRFMPLLTTDDTIESVRIDAKHRGVAVTIASSANPRAARVEVWDLATGRLRGRTKYDRLIEDETYTFQTRTYGDGFVAFAKRDDSSRAMAWAIGLDGVRHPLAGGATRLSLDDGKLVEVAPGELGMIDPGDAGARAVTVWLHAVPSGAVLAKATIPMASDDVDDISLLKMDRGMLGVTQWKSDSGTSTKGSDAKLRIDVIDPHAAARTFIAPGC